MNKAGRSRWLSSLAPRRLQARIPAAYAVLESIGRQGSRTSPALVWQLWFPWNRPSGAISAAAFSPNILSLFIVGGDTRQCIEKVIFTSRLRKNSVRSLSAVRISQRECASLDWVGWSQLRNDDKEVIAIDHPFHVGVYRTEFREAQLAKIVYGPSVRKLVFNSGF